VVQLGVVYNSEDEGSVRLVERLTDFLPGAGFQLADATVTSPEEVEEAVRQLVEQSHVLYILPDATVLAGLDQAIRIAEESDTPLFVADAQLVERGAVGSRAFDYAEIGRQTADVMARVLDGENPSDIPIGQAELTTLVVNVTAAERMGLQLAPGFVARADEVIE
jgi:putative tryptophan/tyrosine transport system substrate-binding protein